MQEEYQISKLVEIRRELDGGRGDFTTMGVIIDSTNPHRKDAKKDFCMKLKIIDSSSPNDPCHVFLYSRHVEDFPKSIKVGDILFLKKYGFEIWNDSLQAKKQFKVLGSEFQFFSGEPNLENYAQIGQQTALDDFDSSILSSIRELRKFSQNYFKKNSVPLYNKNSKKSSDFDLILEVTSSEKLNEGFKLFLTDRQNDFELNYRYSVEPGIYKVRSIADFNWNGKKGILIGNDYTCLLEISSWMKSHNVDDWSKLTPPKNPEAIKAEREIISTNILN